MPTLGALRLRAHPPGIRCCSQLPSGGLLLLPAAGAPCDRASLHMHAGWPAWGGRRWSRGGAWRPSPSTATHTSSPGGKTLLPACLPACTASCPRACSPAAHAAAALRLQLPVCPAGMDAAATPCAPAAGCTALNPPALPLVLHTGWAASPSSALAIRWTSGRCCTATAACSAWSTRKTWSSQSECGGWGVVVVVGREARVTTQRMLLVVWGTPWGVLPLLPVLTRQET